MSTKCVKCDREAEYDSPDELCKFHWLEWWYEDEVRDLEQGWPSKLSKKETKIVTPLLKLVRTNLEKDFSKMEELYLEYQKWMKK